MNDCYLVGPIVRAHGLCRLGRTLGVVLAWDLATLRGFPRQRTAMNGELNTDSNITFSSNNVPSHTIEMPVFVELRSRPVPVWSN